jgi:membrane-associated protein
MRPAAYSLYNLTGAVLWVGGLTYAGYFFGNIPWIKGNLTAIIVGIVAVSLLPLLAAYVRARRAKP